MTTKANGDPLEGTIVPPSNYPNPVDNNVGMHPLDWSLGVGNRLIDSVAPTAPVLTSPAKTTTTVDLAWTASVDTGSGVVAYDVYKAGVLLISVSGATLTYQATGLTTATAYGFQVKARDYAGNATGSNTLTVTTS